jgi:hypothetical protein
MTASGLSVSERWPLNTPEQSWSVQTSAFATVHPRTGPIVALQIDALGLVTVTTALLSPQEARETAEALIREADQAEARNDA